MSEGGQTWIKLVVEMRSSCKVVIASHSAFLSLLHCYTGRNALYKNMVECLFVDVCQKLQRC